MPQLEYNCNFDDEHLYTHHISDGVLGYWTTAPADWTLRQVAEDFASDYEHGDDEAYDDYVVAGISTMPEASVGAYFAFDGNGNFEWETARTGGARGY